MKEGCQRRLGSAIDIALLSLDIVYIAKVTGTNSKFRQSDKWYVMRLPLCWPLSKRLPKVAAEEAQLLTRLFGHALDHASQLLVFALFGLSLQCFCIAFHLLWSQRLHRLNFLLLCLANFTGASENIARSIRPCIHSMSSISYVYKFSALWKQQEMYSTRPRMVFQAQGKYAGQHAEIGTVHRWGVTDELLCTNLSRACTTAWIVCLNYTSLIIAHKRHFRLILLEGANVPTWSSSNQESVSNEIGVRKVNMLVCCCQGKCAWIEFRSPIGRKRGWFRRGRVSI